MAIIVIVVLYFSLGSTTCIVMQSRLVLLAFYIETKTKIQDFTDYAIHFLYIDCCHLSSLLMIYL